MTQSGGKIFQCNSEFLFRCLRQSEFFIESKSSSVQLSAQSVSPLRPVKFFTFSHTPENSEFLVRKNQESQCVRQIVLEIPGITIETQSVQASLAESGVTERLRFCLVPESAVELLSKSTN